MIESSSFLSRFSTVSGRLSPYHACALSQQSCCNSSSAPSIWGVYVPVGDRPYHLDHIGNSVRVCNNDFLRLFFTEISKFLKHFICSSEIKRRLISKVLIALSCLQYLTEYSVLRVFEMHVWVATTGFPSLSPSSTIARLRSLRSSSLLTLPFLGREHIIADRLYLKIIIERCDFLYLLLRFL